MVRAPTTAAESSPSVAEVAISLVKDVIPWIEVYNTCNVVSATMKKGYTLVTKR